MEHSCWVFIEQSIQRAILTINTASWSDKENSTFFFFEVVLNGRGAELLSTSIESEWRTKETEISPSRHHTMACLWPLPFQDFATSRMIIKEDERSWTIGEAWKPTSIYFKIYIIMYIQLRIQILPVECKCMQDALFFNDQSKKQ